MRPANSVHTGPLGIRDNAGVEGACFWATLDRFFVIISLDDSMRCNGVVTADKGTEPFCVFLQFLSRLIRSRLAALRHRSPQYLAGKREAKLSNVQANQNLLAAPEGAPLGCKPLHGPAQG